MKPKKVVLIIMDGWGKGNGTKSDVIANAHTPFINSCYSKYPNSTLLTFGEYVGLPDGQMGNSEVGHLNIGAGRVVYQDLVKINRAIKDKTFYSNKILTEAFEYAKQNDVSVHLMGLVSDGGVHSSQEHLHALCEMAKKSGNNKVFIHAFTDGRDTDPQSGKKFISSLINNIKNTPVKLASIVGRYYAMDRDKRWDRVKVSYDLLTKGKGTPTRQPLDEIQKSYDVGVTDEFIKPICCIDESSGNPLATIKENDVVICFNYRTDRCREITIALTQKDLPENEMQTIPLHYVTMTRYDETFKNINVVYEKDNLKNTLGEIISKAGKTQIRIAETEKYPHVTFFFSGGREETFPGEKRIMEPSPKVATYDLQPEMSALEITDAICKELEKEEADFVCLNFANPDMVGHTGVYEAIIKAVETVDRCTKRVVETGLKHGYSFIITADHGNADYAINEDGTPNTAHSLNPVPCILIDEVYKKIKSGKLADLAPTILKIMGIEIPEEMGGNVLI